MKKIIAKTESYTEFLARGGQVTRCATVKPAMKHGRNKARSNKSVEQANMADLPVALKIAFGIKV